MEPETATNTNWRSRHCRVEHGKKGHPQDLTCLLVKWDQIGLKCCPTFWLLQGRPRIPPFPRLFLWFFLLFHLSIFCSSTNSTFTLVSILDIYHYLYHLKWIFKVKYQSSIVSTLATFHELNIQFYSWIYEILNLVHCGNGVSYNRLILYDHTYDMRTNFS